MKKHIIIGIASLALMASCGSDDSDFHAVAESTIHVTSAQTSLGPNASEGEVTVDCTPVAAYADEPSWLTATIDGNTVKLASQANGSRQSRNAKLVVKKAENDSVVVNVSQYGLVLTADNSDIVQSNDGEASYTKQCSCNTNVEIDYCPDWAKATIDNEQGKMDISLSVNNTGHFRADYIKYHAAGARDSFIVKQYDFDKDIAGTYVFAYNTFTEDYDVEFKTVEAKLDRNGLSVPEWGYTFPIIVNDSIGAISIKSNQNIGRFGKYYVYNAYVATTGAYYYGTESGIITAPFKYSEEYGTYGFFSGIAYNVNNDTATFLAMIIQAYKAKSASQSNYLDDLFWIASPYILKKPASTTAAKQLGNGYMDKAAMSRVKSIWN